MTPTASLAAASVGAATIERFLARAGWSAAVRRPLAGDASVRRYDRLEAAGRFAVLMDSSADPASVQRFVQVGALLRQHGFSAPEVYAADPAAGLLLIEDFGDESFARLLARGANKHDLYFLAGEVLFEMRRRIPATALGAIPPFDDERVLDGLLRFIDWYWPALFCEPASDVVRSSFVGVWRSVLPQRHAVPDVLALFDYHADNLMMLPGRGGIAACGLLDFQDSVRAPAPHDLLSLLEDPRREDPGRALRETARDVFVKASPDIDPPRFALSWAVTAAQRHARTLGTYARLWRRDGKPGYLGYIPRTWIYLEENLAHPALAPVRDWLDRHVPATLRRTAPGPQRTE
jgi:N-acetylmuramate 1-kinase